MLTKNCLERYFKLFCLLLFYSSFSIWGASAWGKKKNKKRTTITFEDELIEGDVKKPDLFYLLEKKRFNYKKLIKLRENFIPEMSHSAEDIPLKGRVK